MEEILIDADIFVSLTVLDDANHRRVSDLYKQIKNKYSLLAISFAFGESLTVISSLTSIKIACRFADLIHREVMIIDVGLELREKGLEVFRRQSSKNTRFTDCVNMALLKDLGQDKIFSFDEHYKKNGFKRLGIDTKV